MKLSKHYFNLYFTTIFVLICSLLFLLLTQNVSAGNCWYDHMTHQMSLCSQDSNKCLWTCVSMEQKERIECFNSCEQIAESCRKKSSADYTTCLEAERALNNLEVKKSVLEKIDDNQSTNQDEYQSENQSEDQVETLPNSKDVQPINIDIKSKTNFASNDTSVEMQIDTLKDSLEWLRDATAVYIDTKDLREYIKTSKFGSYGGVSFITDAGNSFNKFLDLLAVGVSVEDASSKAIIDTAATSAFNLFPPLKAAEIVSTMPDRILEALGISKTNWTRKITGYFKNNSPSAFVEKSTDAMITTGNWSNMVGILGMAVDDVRSAEGFKETIKETGNLIGTTIGAIPVAIVMEAKDRIVDVVSAGKGLVNYFYNLLTD